MSPFLFGPHQGQLYQYGKGQKPPEGAVYLSDTDVLEYSRKIIEQHSEPRDVWALRHGPTALGVAASFSSYYVNQVFREALRIPLRVGFVASYLPAIFLSSFSAVLLHKAVIQDRLVLGQLPCSVCAELRGGSLQAACAVIYPLLMCPVSSLFLARKHNTYPLTPEGVRVLPLLRSLVRPKSRPLLAVLGAQFLVGLALSGQEAVQADRMWLRYSAQHDSSELSESR